MEKLGGYNIDNIYAQACISNFSPALKNDWEQYFPRRTALLTTDQLMEYLDAKMHRVPTVKEVTYSPQDNTRSQPSHSKAKSENYKASKINVKSTTHFKCLMCNNNDHTTGKCPSFASQNVEKRWETIKSFKCCTNCLSPYHSMSKCTSIFTCQKCNKKHHTLLHKETPVKVDSGASRAKINPKLTHSKQDCNSDQVHTVVGFTVLAEAIHNDAVRKVRLPLDTGAEGSLISKSLKNDLQATTLPCDATITGVNSAQSVNEMTNLTLRPIGGGKELKITGYVVNKLREVPSPLHAKEIKEKPYLQGVHISDPNLGGKILLHPDERDFHRFLIEQDKRIVECRMKRLTFGIKSSPFIASRVLQHIAQSHMESHPKAAQAIMQFFYVDDFLTSVYSAKEAIDLKNEICHLLAASGMILRKWLSNCKPLLDDKENADLVLPSPSQSGKALGTHWVVDKDELHVTTPKPEIGRVTKRHIASITAKVYDVLGLFAPAILPARSCCKYCGRITPTGIKISKEN